MMIHYRTDQSDLITNLQSLKAQSANQDVQVFSSKGRMLVRMNPQANRNITSENTVLQTLGIQPSQIRSAHFAWQLDDGFLVCHTHEIALQLSPG